MKKRIEVDVLIIGAGLAGLTAAYALKESRQKTQIVEARDRIGGRIISEGVENGKPVEMGATWLGVKHIYMNQLLKELNLEVFDQVIGEKAIYEAISTSPHYLVSLPENPEPSLRIKGGSSKVLSALSEQLDEGQIIFNEEVMQINEAEDMLEVETSSFIYSAEKVISTIPPNLLLNTIHFHPSLPSNVINISSNTHTWMADSIKVALVYDSPFWRKENVSGTIFSNVGPIPEMYDHSNYEDHFFSLMGFLNGSYYSISKEERLAKILEQLRKYFGDVVDAYNEYHEKVWRNDKWTYHSHDNHVLPHQYNGHEVFQTSYYNDKLILAGTETSKRFPGYMEGAVYSGFSAAKKVEGE